MFRILVALTAIVPVAVVVPPVRDAVSDAATSVLDRFDRRPVRRILIIGNSRTYYHAMPSMVRALADSARTPERFEIVTRALQGGSLEDSWNDAETQRLLAQDWHDVVIQGESRAQSSEAQRLSFHAHAAKLAAAVRAHGVVPVFIVNWVYGEELFDGANPGARDAHYDTIQRDYRRLAFETGARLVNTGAVWEWVHRAEPDLPLYEDGNHPSLEGSYLSALVLDAHLTRADPTRASYVPWGLDPRAAGMRREVAQALAAGA